MPILLANWKFITVILAIMATYYAGYHTRGAFDQIVADKLLQHQIELNEEAQDKMNAKAKQVEGYLANERQKSSDLQKRWSKISGQKHNVCMLSTSTKQLLKDATTTEVDNPK